MHLVRCAVRVLSAKLLGIVVMALSGEAASELMMSLTEPHDKGAKFEMVDGSLCAAGYVLGQTLTGQPVLTNSSVLLLFALTTSVAANLPCAAISLLEP